jgi:hypothetical protein
MKKNTTSIENLPTYGSNKNEKYMWLNNTDLQISPEIQRKLEPMRVAEIQRKFDPLVANPVKVSYRDGQYFIFEGMHTRTALCGLNKTDDFPIFCRVYFGLTKEDEARLFATQFGISKPVPMAYKLRALEVAKDQDVLDFLDITRSNGFTITLGGHSAQNGNIAAKIVNGVEQPDGEYGSATEEAVRSFQQKKGIDADGVIRADTWAALLGVKT